MRLNIEGDAAAARHMSVNIGTCACGRPIGLRADDRR